MVRLNVELIENRRKEMKLTQGQLSRLLEIDESYYSHLKSGRRRPTLVVVEKIYFEMGLGITEILDLTITSG